MNFDPPRILECGGNRLTFHSDNECGILTTEGGAMHTTCILIADAFRGSWREVTPEVTPPPFDISALDTIGVFEPEPVKAIATTFEQWYAEATDKGARYLIDFGCKDAFEAGRNSIKPLPCVCGKMMGKKRREVVSQNCNLKMVISGLQAEARITNVELTQLRADFRTLEAVKDEAFAQAKGLRAEVVTLTKRVAELEPLEDEVYGN
jgi:hypothetical protein